MMIPNRRFSLALLGLASLSFGAGCGGGEGGIGYYFDVNPRKATVAPNASLGIEVVQAEYSVRSYDFSVREAGGGTLAQGTGSQSSGAVYTAPALAGTYHVQAGFTETNGKVHAKTVNLTVGP